jgi:rare lipoprotein A (peptidoglycan hydrolase)
MQKLKWVILLVAVALTVFFAETVFGEKTSKMEVKKEVQEATETIKKYSIEQRDEAVKSTKSTLDKMDKRIDQMESDLNKKWKNMTESAREQKQKSIHALKKKRNEVAEWYGGLKHGSANAWEEIKTGFSNAYEVLGDAVNKAEKELSN